MNCKESQLVLEEYLDGELVQDQADAVAEHLRHCATCSAVLNEQRAELAAYQDYNAAIEVPGDLWHGVQSRLNVVEASVSRPVSRRIQGWFAGLFAAPRISLPVTLALVVAAVVVTTLIVKRAAPTMPDLATANKVTPAVAKNSDSAESPNGKGQLDVPPKASEPKPGPALKQPVRPVNHSFPTGAVAETTAPQSADRLVSEAQKKYLAAITLLSREAARTRSQLDPETRTKLQQALDSIDRTLVATRQAVRENPHDPVAVQFMLLAYAKKVEVLKEMATVSDF